VKRIDPEVLRADRAHRRDLTDRLAKLQPVTKRDEKAMRHADRTGWKAGLN